MMKTVLLLSAMLAASLFSSAQAQAPAQGAAFTLTSQAFRNEADIPYKYTCDSTNVSPALTWENAPAATKSFALIVEDPDAPRGTWTHWIAYNIPATAHGLPEHMPAEPKLADGTRQGKNSFNNPGYGGPCPPKGKGAHRYFFRLYALDNTLRLPAATTNNAALQTAIKGHILGTAVLMGRFGH